MSIAEKLQTIQNIKDNIKTSINNKGGNVGDDFANYATAIDNLPTGGEGGDCSEIIDNARVLEITENGTYTTQYTKDEDVPNSTPSEDVEITGYYDDGTPFYNYAKLTNIVYNTNIVPTRDTRVEFWYMDTNEPSGDAYYEIIGAGAEDVENKCYQLRNFWGYMCNWGGSRVDVPTPSTNEWHHYIISATDGIVIDGNKVLDVSTPNYDGDSPFYLNSIEYAVFDDALRGRHNNGCFGMIKIDGNTIIPTENGFINYTTDEPLEIIKAGEYLYTNNDNSIAKEGELIRTLIVNVPQNVPKIKLTDGTKLSRSTWREVPEYIDFEGVTDMSYMFEKCYKLTTIPEIDTSNVTNMKAMFFECDNLKTIPEIDTSNVTEMSWMFSECENLETIPELNTSNVTNMTNMFSYCTNLTTIPELDTSNVTDMYYMFYYCKSLTTIPELNTSNVRVMEYIFGYCEKLTTIPELDTSNVTDMDYMFYTCSNLTSIPQMDVSNVKSMYSMFAYCSNLENVGKLDGLKCSLNLSDSPNLTYQSCINILNGLWDFRGNGDETTTKTLTVHQNFVDLIGDDIKIALNKGWTVNVA